MKFDGFQKLTLLDYPGKVAATLFCAGCNFRCPFCHNAALVTHIDGNEVFDEEDVLAFLSKRKGLLDGVAVTGGEPTLRRELPAFLARVKSLGYAVKLDTNGTNPAVLRRLADDGLIDYVAMDIKNQKEKYAETAGVPDLDLAPIEESVRFLLSGAVDYEFRTTVVGEFHTEDDFRAIGEWIRGARRYFLQNFVDSGDLILPGLHPVPKEKLEAMRTVVSAYVPNTQLRGV